MKASNSLNSLRSMMFEEMIALRSGERTAQEATAVSKLAGRVIDTYKIEIEAVRTANDLKDKNITYVKSLTSIEQGANDDL